jgi:hypothetical protein
MFNGILTTLSSCFSERRREDDHQPRSRMINNIHVLNTYSDEPLNTVNVDSSKNYIFKIICEQIATEGLYCYILQPYSRKNKVKSVNVKFDFSNNNLIVKRNSCEKEIIVNLDKVQEIIFGMETSNFIIMSSKIDITPWRSVSLIDEMYETYDFIFENDEETFYFLIILKVCKDIDQRKKVESGDMRIKIDTIFRNLMWKRVYIKFIHMKTKIN